MLGAVASRRHRSAPGWLHRAARAEEAVGDTRFFEPASQLGGDVRAHVVGRLCDLISQFLAAVDERDDVAEVTAAQEVAVAAAFERFELRGEELGGFVL